MKQFVVHGLRDGFGESVIKRSAGPSSDRGNLRTLPNGIATLSRWPERTGAGTVGV